jgi:cell division protein FtsI/penicillin-binding protein 2
MGRSSTIRTAYRRFLNFPITVYGKTGTAETA